MNPAAILAIVLTVIGFKYYPALLALLLATGFVIATAKVEAR